MPGTVVGAGDEALNKRHKLVLDWVPALLSNERIRSMLRCASQTKLVIGIKQVKGLAALQGFD